jgi:hypothetical protein
MLGIANKALSLAAEASIHEEPGAGKPHAARLCSAVRDWNHSTSVTPRPMCHEAQRAINLAVPLQSID